MGATARIHWLLATPFAEDAALRLPLLHPEYVPRGDLLAAALAGGLC